MNYKTLFILSVIINVIFIVGFIYFWNVGSDILQNEADCSYFVCDGYDTFTYDEYTDMCGCYLGDSLEKVEDMSRWGD